MGNSVGRMPPLVVSFHQVAESRVSREPRLIWGNLLPKAVRQTLNSLTSELADADPLGVDTNIDFTAVGGLDDCTNPSFNR